MGAVRNYFGGALLAALVAAGSYYVYKHGTLPDWYWEARLPDTVEPLDVADTGYLKKVLFSGEPWLIQCYSGLPWEGQHLPRPFRIAQAFKARAAQGHGIPVHPTLLCDACRR